MNLVQSAEASGFGVLIFDPGFDYERLVRVIPDMVVMDATEVAFNPLQPPPNMSLEQWTSSFIQLFAQNYELKDPSISILQKAMKTIIEKVKDGLLQQLVLSDLLTKPEPKLNKEKRKKVKEVAKNLLRIMKEEKLAFD